MFDKFYDELSDKEYESVDEYLDAVRVCTSVLEDDLYKASRWYKSLDCDMLKQNEITIKGYNDEEEDD